MWIKTAHLPSLLLSSLVIAPTLALASACGSSHGSGHDGGAFWDDFGLPPGPSDAGQDGGPPLASCDAMDARQIVCPEVTCDGGPGYFWNGDSCYPVDCGACEGIDCALAATLDECISAHAGCESAVCLATGGQWMWWSDECEHYVCGRPPPVDCVVGVPVCDCGAYRSFDLERGGCYADTTCPTAEPITREELCTTTGGTWENICCDTECGVFCDADCAAPACNCGPGRVFEEARGCIDSVRCHERRAMETCTPDVRCEAGTICCDACSGVGCTGEPRCVPPVCDDDPNTDECGNNLLAP